MRIRDEKKYNSIVKSSIRLVNQLGFSGISISKIAKAAKVSPATIYIYFENKQDLFTKIYVDIRNQMSQAGLQDVEKQKTIEEKFKSIWLNFFSFAKTHKGYIIYREQFEQTSMIKDIDVQSFELFKYITELLQQGIKEDIIRDLPLPFLTSFAFIPLITLLRYDFDGSIIIDDKLLIEASSIAWKTIIKDN